MTSLGDILKDRLGSYHESPECIEDRIKNNGKEYQKNWAFAVKCFQDRINKDRKASNLKPLPFIAVRQKLVALWEIDDLRWFYRECIRYSNTYRKERDIKGKPIRNTFSACFFGALDVKKVR